MRIVVIAPGSRGDVEPYLALSQGLNRAGHVVRLVSHQNFESFVRSHGVEFWPIPGNVQDIVQNQDMRALLENGNFLAILLQMGREAERSALALTEGALAACEGMELLVAGIGGLFVGLALAEKLDLPLLQAYYMPFTPTQAYASFLFPKLPPPFGGTLNRASYRLAQQVMWQGFRSADARARKHVLDLPPAPFWGPFHAAHLQHAPILYAYSPAVIPRPADWGEEIHVTGYWFLEPADDWSPPAALSEFLQAGPPPVYIGFGSMSSRNPEQTAALVLEALEQAGQRAVILAGWGSLQATDLPDSVFVVDAVPFSWLLARVAAVVHHGGAGTTSAGLRAGVPSVVVPFFGDQPYWGRRIAELGVGPEPIPRKKLTAERLARAIQQAVRDQPMRQRAAELGMRIRAEDGVGRAVAIIQKMEIRY